MTPTNECWFLKFTYLESRIFIPVMLLLIDTFVKLLLELPSEANYKKDKKSSLKILQICVIHVFKPHKICKICMSHISIKHVHTCRFYTYNCSFPSFSCLFINK